MLGRLGSAARHIPLQISQLHLWKLTEITPEFERPMNLGSRYARERGNGFVQVALGNIQVDAVNLADLIPVRGRELDYNHCAWSLKLEERAENEPSSLKYV